MVITDQRVYVETWKNIEKYDIEQSNESLLPVIPKTIYIANTNNYNEQSEMIKSYQLKIYPNKEKAKELNKLITFWVDKVNHYLRIFWNFKDLRENYPPKEYTRGGRLIRDAAVKAWQIMKIAKMTGQINKPYYNTKEIDLNESSSKIIKGFETKKFDLWLNIIALGSKKGRGNSKRLKLPCKRYREFNKAKEKGKLRKGIKISREGKSYYATFFFEFPERKSENKKVVGIDVGMNHPAVTSNGQKFGDELRDLRIRTKWRHYKRLAAYKQGLNRIAKDIVEVYPNCDFAVERLLFKGSRKRSRRFRRNNLNWAYSHLSHKLEEIGHLEGFRVWKVNPALSSQRCTQCGFTSKENRRSDEVFSCGLCGYTGDADHVGARNLAERVTKEHPSLGLTPLLDICPNISIKEEVS